MEDSMIPWEIKATELVNCNCAYGCPCQFNALPTHGFCEAISAYKITEGFHGDVRIDGLNAIAIFQWPGAIHHGKGKAFRIIDKRANETQRQSLRRILEGEDTEPGKTVWNVFAATLDHIFDPMFEDIAIDIDVDARRAHVSVPGLVDVSAEPIRNPVTGAEHRARIDLPDGFEYRIAEMGSGSARVEGPIPLTLNGTYAQLAHLHLNQNGVVH
jgi:hypothetical protein